MIGSYTVQAGDALGAIDTDDQRPCTARRPDGWECQHAAGWIGHLGYGTGPRSWGPLPHDSTGCGISQSHRHHPYAPVSPLEGS